jgi:hypothetical protein
MNPLYEKGKDIILIRRTSDNKEFEEFPLTLQPVSALVTDPTNDVVCVGLCALSVGFATSASYSQTTTALNALSASYANSSSYSFSSSYATYASTASIALEVSSAISASYSLSSSHAISSSYAKTSSVAIISISASVTNVGDNDQYTPILTLGDGNLKVAGGGTSTFWFNPGTSTFSVGGTIIASTISCSVITASLSFATSSNPPLNTASVVQWIDVTLNGSTYKMPLYL